MSQGYSSTRKDQETLPRYEKRWHAALELCFIESFYYVTETGKSWAGPIEHATFCVETAGLEYCLKHRPMRDFDLPNPKTAQEQWEYATTIPMIGGAFYQSIEPDGGKFDAKTGTTTWEYRNYKPGEPLILPTTSLRFRALPPTANPGCGISLAETRQGRSGGTAGDRSGLLRDRSEIGIGQEVRGTADLVSPQGWLAGSETERGTEGSSLAA